MNFETFFQENIILFIAGFAVLGFLLFLEVSGLKSKETTLNYSLFIQKINQGAVLIDLRSSEDFLKGHIAGAKNIIKDDLHNHLNNLPKDKTIALYCYKGILSSQAINDMRKSGFNKLVHLGGGMEEWKRENLPTAKA